MSLIGLDEGRSTLPPDQPVIHLRKAAFGYGVRTIVSDLDLKVFPGEVVAILGPNGAGKSTAVKGLLGLSTHIGGEVDVLGSALGTLKEPWRIGYVPQRFTLSSTVPASVEEIVAVGRVHHTPWHGRLSRRDRKICSDALEFVKMKEFAHADVEALSGGQQRRVLIARALASRPDVLIMDEPTAGVDEPNQLLLADCMKALADQGKAIIVITHELPNLFHVVTRAVVIARGRIEYDGEPHGALGGSAQDDMAGTGRVTPRAFLQSGGLPAVVAAAAAAGTVASQAAPDSTGVPAAAAPMAGANGVLPDAGQAGAPPYGMTPVYGPPGSPVYYAQPAPPWGGPPPGYPVQHYPGGAYPTGAYPPPYVVPAHPGLPHGYEQCPHTAPHERADHDGRPAAPDGMAAYHPERMYPPGHDHHRPRRHRDTPVGSEARVGSTSPIAEERAAHYFREGDGDA